MVIGFLVPQISHLFINPITKGRISPPENTQQTTRVAAFFHCAVVSLNLRMTINRIAGLLINLFLGSPLTARK